MAALKMHCSTAIVGTNLGTSFDGRTKNGATLIPSENFVGLKMMPSLQAASFCTRSVPVNTAPVTQLTK